MLLDTSGLLCLHHKVEPFHHAAVAAYKSASIRLTHNYILAEFIALAHARHIPRSKAITFIADLLENPDIETVWSDKQITQDSITLLQTRQDKTYSLCDAVSFMLMRQRNITTALTTDKHFDQEGFQKLLGKN